MSPREAKASVREAVSGEESAIAAVHDAAFGQLDESRIVEGVLANSERVVSLVATVEDLVVGHALFSRVEIEEQVDRTPAMALGPIGVLPAYQRTGIGSVLIRAGFEACRRLGENVVFVLGHPSYYPRLGFRPAVPLGLHYRDRRLDPAFMVIELEAGALRGRRGWIRYHPAFGGS